MRYRTMDRETFFSSFKRTPRTIERCKMTYLFRCKICSKEFNTVQRMNEQHIAYCCKVEASRIWTIPHTNKDQMYNFTNDFSFKKGYDIHSKRQYERICKKEGSILMSPSERKSLKPTIDTMPSIKRCTERIMRKVAKDGLMSKFKKLKDVLPKGRGL